MPKLTMPDSNYDRDFYAWTNEQAALLRAGKLGQADLAHIAEEIESMGRTEKRELVSRLTVLLLHLLNWRFQPELRSTSWRLSVEEQRIQAASHLGDNPSLKALLATAIADGYRLAVIGARRETGLNAATFPAACPWSFDQMIDDDFWPE
jgi:Domain of unknown function DUF29